MTIEEPDRPVYWIRTMGGPRPGDPRDGELHQFFGRLPDAFDLEPSDDDPEGEDAHYVKDRSSPPAMEDGRQIWRFVYRPY